MLFVVCGACGVLGAGGQNLLKKHDRTESCFSSQPTPERCCCWGQASLHQIKIPFATPQPTIISFTGPSLGHHKRQMSISWPQDITQNKLPNNLVHAQGRQRFVQPPPTCFWLPHFSFVKHTEEGETTETNQPQYSKGKETLT